MCQTGFEGLFRLKLTLSQLDHLPYQPQAFSETRSQLGIARPAGCRRNGSKACTRCSGQTHLSCHYVLPIWGEGQSTQGLPGDKKRVVTGPTKGDCALSVCPLLIPKAGVGLKEQVPVAPTQPESPVCPAWHSGKWNRSKGLFFPQHQTLKTQDEDLLSSPVSFPRPSPS